MRDIIENVYTEYDTEELAKAFVKSIEDYYTIVNEDDAICADVIKSELQEFFYDLKLTAENKYNRAYHRVAWNVFQAFAQTVLDYE